MITYDNIHRYLVDNTMKLQPYKEIVRNYLKDNSISGDDVKLAESYFEDAKKDFKNFNFLNSIIMNELAEDIPTGDLYIVNHELGKIQPISKAQNLKQFFSSNHYIEYCKTKKIAVKRGYNPNTLELIHKGDDVLPTLNMYNAPEWRTRYVFDSNVELPEIYEKFFTYLTDNVQQSYLYLINFLAATIQPGPKPLTYLTMLSGQGTGKGTLFDILELLLGSDNVSQVTASNLDNISRFNSWALNKKLIFFDELTIRNVEDESIIKQYVNNKIDIEIKQKSIATYDNYASIMCASNSLANMRVSKDDRRYTYIDMPKTNLLSFVKENYNIDIDKYQAMLKDMNSIEKLGKYLMQYNVDRNILNFPIDTRAKSDRLVQSLKDYEIAIFQQMAPEYAGKELTLIEAKNKLQEITDNSKIFMNRDSWKRLSELVPGFFKRKIKKINNKKVYYIKFEDLDKQPTTISGFEEED